MLQNKDRIKQVDTPQSIKSQLITDKDIFYISNTLLGKASSGDVQMWLRDVHSDHPPEATGKGVRDTSNAATIFSAYGAVRIQAIPTQPSVKA